MQTIARRGSSGIIDQPQSTAIDPEKAGSGNPKFPIPNPGRSMMRAVRIHEQGGPEVMRVEEVPVPQPRAGEALVRLEAVGVNFLDVYKRSGAYTLALP